MMPMARGLPQRDPVAMRSNLESVERVREPERRRRAPRRSMRTCTSLHAARRARSARARPPSALDRVRRVDYRPLGRVRMGVHPDRAGDADAADVRGHVRNYGAHAEAVHGFYRRLPGARSYRFADVLRHARRYRHVDGTDGRIPVGISAGCGGCAARSRGSEACDRREGGFGSDGDRGRHGGLLGVHHRDVRVRMLPVRCCGRRRFGGSFHGDHRALRRARLAEGGGRCAMRSRCASSSAQA